MAPRARRTPRKAARIKSTRDDSLPRKAKAAAALARSPAAITGIGTGMRPWPTLRPMQLLKFVYPWMEHAPGTTANGTLNPYIHKTLVRVPESRWTSEASSDKLLALLYVLATHPEQCIWFPRAPAAPAKPPLALGQNLAPQLVRALGQELAPQFVAVWSPDNRTLTWPTGFWEFQRQCRSTNRLLVLMLFLQAPARTASGGSESDGHANVLVATTTRLERFEPHGAETGVASSWRIPAMQAALEKAAKANGLRYVDASEFCEALGPQSVQAREPKSVRLPSDPPGYCAAWSIWWMDLRLSHHTLDERQLLKKATEILKSNQARLPLTQFIRDYASFALDSGLTILRYVAQRPSLDLADKADVVQTLLRSWIPLLLFLGNKQPPTVSANLYETPQPTRFQGAPRASLAKLPPPKKWFNWFF